MRRVLSLLAIAVPLWSALRPGPELPTPNAALVSGRILNPESVSYDPLKDLTPLGLATRTSVILTVRGDAPYRTLPEMVEFAKKNSGKVRAANVGMESIGHLSVEMLKALTGAGLPSVPFKGGAPAITALLGGHVEVGALSVGATSGHLKSGAPAWPGRVGQVSGHPVRREG
jgi:tripartite-type tricarboxylate transporter receptor subunit TctC